MTAHETYQKLRETLVENSVLASTASLLGWDELTYMPPEGAEGRARQLSLLSRMVHDRFVVPEVGRKLEDLSEDIDALEPDAASNVREWQRIYQREVRVPSSLVEEMARTAVLSRQAWGEAKAANDFPKFLPWLEKTVEQRRQLAACLLGHEPASPDEQYDALLDEYEPYETTAKLREMFAELRPELTALIERVKGSKRKNTREVLQRKYLVDRQKILAEEAAAKIGFDTRAGRLDTTIHPFCTTIAPGDVRITTRYDENDLGNCFFSVIHETGHALYEQGLPRDHWGTPRGDAVSLGVHESQSRLWENMVCRGEAFWRYDYPRAQELFPDSLGDVALDDFLAAVNVVGPSPIRTESDEATYNLHIILRFELEMALLWGELKPADLPGAWNARMEKYLGIRAKDDRTGCLQDVHWSQGAFGYFPTYTLGNLNAAALMEAAGKDLGDLEAQFARGEFKPLLDWLREKVHRFGKRYPASELMRKATGQERSIRPLISHLTRKVDRWYR